MTDARFDNPDYVASAAETAAKVKTKRLELLGGPRFVWGIGLLLVAVFLLDTFGLGALMATQWVHPSGPMMFRDICSATEPAGSGGFAFFFIGLLAVTLAFLQIAAPRSITGGLLFFLLTATVGQYFVANNSSIDNIMGKPPISLLWEERISCVPSGGGTPKTAANYRYNPVFDRGPGDSGTAGVPVRFTTMLVANLGLLAIFAASAAIAALVIWISRKVKKAAPETGPIEGIFGVVARGPVEKAIIVRTAVLTVLAVIMGPILIMVFSADPVTGRGGADVTQAINNILWIGPVVFLVDLARVALWSPQPEAETGFETTDVQDAPDLFLPAVLADLRAGQGAQVLMDYSLAPLATAKPWPLEVSAADFADKADIPVVGEGNLHFETLTNWHYDLIIETMNRRVFDRGRKALLICPVDVIANVKDALESGLAKNPGLNVVNWWSYGDPMPPIDDIELIVVSPESLESLVAEVFGYQEFFWLLGGIFVLNLHRMDLGLLHVSLKRIERHVRSAGDMVAILQSEYRHKMPDWSKNLPLLVHIYIHRKQRSAVNESIPQHLAILAPRASENYSGDKGNWPVGLRSLIAIARQEQRALPYLFDVHKRHVRSFWHDTVLQSLRNDGEEATISWAENYRTPALVPESHPHAVAQLSDQSNIINLLGSDIGTPGALEALRLVTVGGYPGATFLVSRIAAEMRAAANDADRRDAIRRLQETLGSLAPKPEGGPIELALMVRQEFMSATRARVGGKAGQDGFKTLTQERVGALWDASSPALQQLRISNTKAGLEKLFRITLQPQNSGEMLHGAQTEHRSYEYTLTELATRNIDAMAMLELSIQDPNAGLVGNKRPERLLLSDHGLSYAKGTRLALAGRIYEVQGVEGSSRRLRVRYSEDSPALPYTFVRDYGILTTAADESGFAADDQRRWLNRKVPHETAIGYLQAARRTRAIYRHDNVQKPFNGVDNAPQRIDVDAQSPLQLRSAMILRLLAPNTPPATARGGAARGRIRRPAGDVNAALAFTLATTLQDVLHMLFPANAHRIAVLSPQSGTQNAQGGVEEFARLRQPMLHSVDPAGAGVADRRRNASDHGLDPRDVAAHARLAGLFFDRARSVVKADNHEKASTLQLFVLEDSDHDIGVAKALFQSDVFGNVLVFWRDYVAHCVDNAEDTENAAYAFGSGRIALCYDFEGALGTLDDMIAEDE